MPPAHLCRVSVCTFVGVLMTGHTIFPVSPRNSPVAIAHLLRKTGVTHLLIGREPAFQTLVIPRVWCCKPLVIASS